MAFVLVVGLAGAGGLVYGETAEETSDVTVTASEDTIEVDDVTYTDGSGTDQDIITDNAEGDNFGYSESDPEQTDTDQIDFSVTVTVYSDDMDSLDFARINIYAQNEDIGDALGTEGDAGHFYHEWENPDDGSDDVWDGESQELTTELTTDDTNTFLRYGDWDIYAEVDNTETGDPEDFEEFTEALFAQEHTVFLGPADVFGSVEPSGSIGINVDADVTFTVDNGGTGEPHVEVTANYAWSLSMSDTTLNHDDTDDTIDATTADYDANTGSPADEANQDVQYLYETEEGTRPGTYSTTVTHTLTNEDTST